jgi:hypothetical protein
LLVNVFRQVKAIGTNSPETWQPAVLIRQHLFLGSGSQNLRGVLNPVFCATAAGFFGRNATSRRCHPRCLLRERGRQHFIERVNEPATNGIVDAGVNWNSRFEADSQQFIATPGSASRPPCHLFTQLSQDTLQSIQIFGPRFRLPMGTGIEKRF